MGLTKPYGNGGGDGRWMIGMVMVPQVSLGVRPPQRTPEQQRHGPVAEEELNGRAETKSLRKPRLVAPPESE